MGPGDRKTRRTWWSGTARRPPNGGFARWSSTSFALGVTGTRARSSRVRMSPALRPAPRNRLATAGAWGAAGATRSTSRPAWETRCSSQLLFSSSSFRYPLVRSMIRSLAAALRQPALAPLVVLGVLEGALGASFPDPEVELPDVRVLSQLLAWTVQDHLAHLHDVAERRDLERQGGVLLHEENRGLLLLVDLLDDPEDLLHEHRSEAEARLVEEEQIRSRHQRPTDGEHLLLAAREIPRELVPAVLEPGEVVEHEVHVPLDARPIAPGVGAATEVLDDVEVLEDPTALHDLEDPHPDDLLGVLAVDLLAHELDGPLGHLALLALEEPGDGLEGRGLPGSVRAEERGDLSLLARARQPFQDKDHVTVDDLDVVDGQHGFGSSLPFVRRTEVRCGRGRRGRTIPPRPRSPDQKPIHSGLRGSSMVAFFTILPPWNSARMTDMNGRWSVGV